jgi:hypothetical protein
MTSLPSSKRRTEGPERARTAVADDGALRALLANIVDYAGLFPPAGLDMPTAVRAYDGYRNGEHAWMLGAFVVPASRLGELAAAVEGTGASGAWPISLLVSSFDEGVAVLGGARGRWHVRALELTPQEPGKVRAGNGGVQLFYEVPLNDGVDARLDAITRAAAAAKVRTGGIEARAFPTAERLAHFIHGCVERDLPFKATAGLHHPLRGRYALTYERASAHGEMFGFLEVALVAGLLEIGEPRGPFGDYAADGRDPARVAADVDAESPQALVGVREVDRPFVLQLLFLSEIQDLFDESARLFGCELAVLQRDELAIESHERGEAHREVDVGAALFATELKERVDPRHQSSTRSRSAKTSIAVA